ncbi:SIMPL domain-containing protein [Actinoplanes sp. NEAU-A12]|uniref:SIMPL domain-containing protein n=1 Tax=Actinoplanes sandaracinus TaxID=3045177 RepID=A0ABT6WYR1_9ACTN|nr:SIMPL domain-containing protein [Actinoplanes sandaracinus]MDI6104872.1 SIMPL domain-containing protein [Actinoplanes sandaracinus]
MNKPRVTVPALVVLATLVANSSWLLDGRPAAASAGAPTDSAATDPLRESVSVTGTGEVAGEPDTLIANFAVETSASTVGEAVSKANVAAARMGDALAGAGVVRADLQTQNVTITSRQNDDEKIIGYGVSQGLTATIRDLPRAGAIMSAGITAGGDAARLNDVSFAIEDDTALLAEARKKAFADARGKAALYAREAGRPLGRVVKVSEETPRFFGGQGEHNKMAMADFTVPIEPGRQRLTVTVTVEWAFGLPPASRSLGLASSR